MLPKSSIDLLCYEGIDVMSPAAYHRASHIIRGCDPELGSDGVISELSLRTENQSPKGLHGGGLGTRCLTCVGPPRCRQDDDVDLDVFRNESSPAERWVKRVGLSHMAKSGASRPLVLLAHAIAACLFICRGLIAWHRLHVVEVVRSCALAAVYFIVGIAVPLRARIVADSSEVRRIMKLREIYSEEKDKSIRTFLEVAKWLWPACTSLGLVAPIVFLLQVAYDTPHADGTFGLSSWSLLVFSCAFLWFLGMLVLDVARTDEAVLDASRVSIKGLIAELKVEFAKVDWALMGRRHRLLDLLLEEVWSISCTGGIWSARILLLLGASLVMASLGIGNHAYGMRFAYFLSSFVFALGASGLLLRLAAITGLCRDGRTGADSILSATQNFIGTFCNSTLNQSTRTRQAEVAAFDYQLFLTYLQTSTVGVEMFGVAVSFELVFSLGIRLCVYAPLALAILGQVLTPHD